MELFESKDVFTTPKPEGLLEGVIHISTEKEDIVLDFFAGSATTAAVAHKMGRQWITVEQMDYLETVALERLKKVIGKRIATEDTLLGGLEYDKGGISDSVTWRGDGDFVYCELMRYNQIYIDRIQTAESSEELVMLYKDIAAGSFLKWYVNHRYSDNAVDDFIAIGQGENGLEKQKKCLVGLLNKNQLYVNLSEIDDEDFAVSKKDKALNQEFYGVLS